MIIKTNEPFELILSPPELITKDTLLTTITNSEFDAFYIQSPKMKYRFNDDKVILLFDSCSRNNDFYRFIRQIEQTICDKLSILSKDYFSEFIESKTIQDTLLRSIIGLPESLSDALSTTIKLDKECQFFTGPDKPITAPPSVTEYDRGTFVLCVQDIAISSLQAVVHWKVVQAQFHRVKRPQQPAGFGIVADDTVNDAVNAEGAAGDAEDKRPKLIIGHRIK